MKHTESMFTRTLLVFAASVAAAPCSYPFNYSNVEVWGLSAAPAAATAAACAAACCNLPGCVVWQLCPASTSCGSTAGPSCWVGPLGGATRVVAGWVSAASTPRPSDRVVALSRAPSPAPIPNVPPATAPSGATISLDTLSLRLNGVPILPVAGEIHPSRVPVSRWREDLLKMKAGGLSIVSAYLMWLHTEEVRGVQDFSGNRNVSLFLDTALDVGLMVALRIGPWDHGECRNGGLPDWVVASCTGTCRLRENETEFMTMVESWYGGLARHVVGRGWAEGGPVISIQVDNETPNVSYLLALKNMAVALGMRPAFWVKTGWPSPSTPVPYGSLVPLFGGYVDDFCSYIRRYPPK